MMTSPFLRPATATRSSAGASTTPVSPMTAGDADGVFVPAEACRPLLRVIILGLGELRRRDGGAPVAPGLQEQLRELDRLDMSASGHPLAIMAEQCWLPASEAARLAGTSTRHARRLAAAGRLIARRRGRDWEIDAASAQDYGKERARATAHDDR